MAVVPSLYNIFTGNFENKAIPRDKLDSPSHLHLVAGLFIYNPELRKFLVQQRASSKHTFPEHFTDSASGHVKACKSMTIDTIKAEMCRELHEEMGITANPEHLRLWTLFQDPVMNEIKFIFVGKSTTITLRLELAEVTTRSRWYSAEELEHLLKSEKFVFPVGGLWEILIKAEHRFDRFYDGLDGWQAYRKWTTGLKRFHDWISSSKKPARVPLFLGRFQPFHLGHLKCLQRIRETSKDVIIGIGSAQYSRDSRNPLTYPEREAIITQSIEDAKLGFDHVFFVPVPDVHSEDLWMQNVKLLLGNDILLYSNNDWVRGLAEKTGIAVGEKFQFAMDRLNGTRIRELIRDGGDWQSSVPPSCAVYLQKKRLVEDIKKAMQDIG